jgi:hypothetical protein
MCLLCFSCGAAVRRTESCGCAGRLYHGFRALLVFSARTERQLVAVSLLSIFWDCLHAVHSGGRDRGKSVFL